VDTALARRWIEALAVSVAEHTTELTALDTAIGDGDHGTNLHRGFAAVLPALAAAAPATVGDVLTRTGATLISTVGGAAGPLYGTAFRAAGKALPQPEATPAELVEALQTGLDAVRRLGGAAPGDKTMVDAWTPALDAMRAALAPAADSDGPDGAGAPVSLRDVAAAGAAAAEQGQRATADLTARKGRASYLGERSIGHRDPGAASSWLLFRALAEVTGVGIGPVAPAAEPTLSGRSAGEPTEADGSAGEPTEADGSAAGAPGNPGSAAGSRGNAGSAAGAPGNAGSAAQPTGDAGPAEGGG
jgi:dihydroxyacetone kinase-like protein